MGPVSLGSARGQNSEEKGSEKGSSKGTSEDSRRPAMTLAISEKRGGPSIGSGTGDTGAAGRK